MDNFAFEYDPYDISPCTDASYEERKEKIDAIRAECNNFQLNVAPVQTTAPEYCELSTKIQILDQISDKQISKIISQQPHYGRKSVVTICPNCHFEVRIVKCEKKRLLTPFAKIVAQMSQWGIF